MKINKALKVILVDCIALLIGIINGFLLPKFLDIESYAYIKTFTLYIAYSGMFHLGFSDGVYILLGGKKLSEVSRGKIKGYLISLIKILSVVFIIFSIISVLIIKDKIFKYFIIYTIAYQIVLFICLLYRATGEFGKYSFIRIIINGFSLLSTAVILIKKDPFMYINIQIIGYLLISIYYLFKILLNKCKIEKSSFKEVKYLISMGFLIMIAGTITNLFFSLDRWIIKFKFSTNEFAYYSFGVSMLNLFITLITSISIIFYPYLARSKNKETINYMIKKIIIIITSFAPAGYFFVAFIVENYISKYKASLEVLGILILSIPFIALINILYSNLYKTENKGKIYLFTAIKMLLISFILNILCLLLFKNSVSIAYATLISLIIWYLYSSRHFERLNIKISEIIYFIIYILAYIVIKNININTILKMIYFIIVIIISIFIFFRNDIVKMNNLTINKKGERNE